MIKAPQPPLIILIDLLFVFLFISILNQDKGLTISFIDNKFPSDVSLFSRDGENYKAINDENSISSTSLIWGCGSFVECSRLYPNKSIYFNLPKLINDDLSKISLLSMASTACTKINVPLKSSFDSRTLISYSELMAQNTCLDKIQGAEIWRNTD